MINNKKNPDSATVSISYSFLVIALVVLLAALGLLRIIDYRAGLQIRLSEYIQLASFGSVAIGLFYNSLSLRYNYAINRLRLEKEAQAAAMEKLRFSYHIISDWFRADMAMNAEKARRFIIPYKGQLQRAERLEEFKQKLEEEQGIEIRKSLMAVLNYFETLALLSEDGIVDEVILKKCFKTTFRTYYGNLKEFIEDIQRGNDGGNAKLFIGFVSLNKRWSET